MSQLIYEAISLGALTVLFGNAIACVLDVIVLSPNLKQKLPLGITKDNFYQMGVLLFLTGVFIHIFCELVGINKWYCKNGFACQRQ